jgi:hypothetical protein
MKKKDEKKRRKKRDKNEIKKEHIFHKKNCIINT